MIAIIDYDAGNIKSVEKSRTISWRRSHNYKRQGCHYGQLWSYSSGCWKFGDAMGKSMNMDSKNVIYDVVDSGKPFLGICLGLQLLFKTSEETPGVTGLGIVDGQILRIPDAPGLKIPQIGWNSLDINPKARLFKGLPEHPYVYFVHSYYLKADHEEDVAASTFYSTNIHASIEHGNVFACQFHPEKSSTVGLQILKNFIELEA